MTWRLGIGAALLGALTFSQPSWADPPSASTLTVCSGSPSKNYYFAVAEWLKRVPHDLFQKGQNIATAGSLDNLRKMESGDCVAGMAQSDVLTQYMIENPASRDTFSVMKRMYVEYIHVLCSTKVKANSLSEFAKMPGSKKLIVDQESSGTAQTWRLLRQVNGKLYDPIQRDPQPSDVTSATIVMDSNDTCMLMVSGLNSSDMVAINQLSVKTQNGKPGLKLISVDDAAFQKIKGFDGKPLYTQQEVIPAAPSNKGPGLYNNLINNGGLFSSASIDVLTVPAYMMVRNDWRDSIGRERLSRLTAGLVDALPTVWARVNPAGSNE